MSKLTYEERSNLKSNKFALEKQRKYPIPDASHARNALARVSESLHKGNISVQQANEVRAKAHRMLED